MADQVVPNTTLDSVAVRAIVWEILRVSTVPQFKDSESAEDAAKRIANAYITVFQAVYHSEPITTQLDELSK